MLASALKKIVILQLIQSPITQVSLRILCAPLALQESTELRSSVFPFLEVVYVGG